MISNQALLQARCAVCGSSSTDKTRLFDVAGVLLVDLLFWSKGKDADRSSAQFSPLMPRDRIHDGIKPLRIQSDAGGSLIQQDTHFEPVKASAQFSEV